MPKKVAENRDLKFLQLIEEMNKCRKHIESQLNVKGSIQSNNILLVVL